MSKGNENIKDNTVLQSEVTHIDYMPVCRPKKRTGFFFNINTGLLQEVGIAPFAFYIKLKSLYSNSTIYNYSLRKVSRLAGCSTTLAKKNLTILEKYGLIEYHHGNLTLKSQKNFSLKYRGKAKILINPDMSILVLKDKLIALLIERKQNQQRYTINKSIRKDRVQRGTSNSKVLVDAICEESLAIGLRSLSDYLKVSSSYLCSNLNRLKNDGKVKIKHIKENLGNAPIINKYYEEGYLYKDKKGQTILFKGSVYSFSI